MDGRGGLQIQNISANIKQTILGSPPSGGPLTWGWERVLANLSPKNIKILREVTKNV
jgi:hypothetical protein